MKGHLVSIITPSFNSEKFISDTIQSVQNQTYQNWEMIIVDDGSTDETVSIIQEFLHDNRIQLHQLDKNSGTGIARNTAISLAKGRYIAFLDSDDLWKPEKLQKQVEFMTSKNQPFTFSYYECIDEEGKPLGKIIQAPKILTNRQLFWSNWVGNLTGIYDVNFFGKIAISSARKRQDWMMWLNILKKIKTAEPVPESLAIYRIRENSISASKTVLLRHNYKVYRDFHHKSIIGSVICMIGFLFTHFFIKPKYVKKSRPE
ncbi:glycosyltransferase family 2 protein [uncultured Flavobacterium sp.]|uniref:glycosyltransferase family 2 protein n=1 Tax=uncultured Flavobacterium sp. TaxID=165435 RepID=UPI0012106354|nr:glycosyltransferase family 2 protein [uncultured Flavobacterium sp.]THD32809.1 MAG: glycosyltransferase family 2 protein [Flavobacterium johnsoniae]